MDTQIVETPRGSVDPTENLDKWLGERSERDAEPEAPTGQSNAPDSPAEPTVAEPQAPPATEVSTEPWWETGLAEAGHGFLKNRKGPEVEKAFRHVETAKQAAERRAALLEQQLEQVRRDREAEAAVLRVQNAQQPQAEKPTPEAELEALFWTDQAEYTRRVREMAKQDALQEWNAAASARESEHRQQVSVSAGKQAVDQIASEYGVDAATAARMVMSTFTHLAASDDLDVWTKADSYVDQVRWLHPRTTPAAPIVAPPVPELPNPPGSKRPATTTPRTPELRSAMSSEEEAMRREIARIADVDPDRYIKRGRHA